MTVWVDADATPNAVKDILVRASLKREIDVVLVANHYIQKPRSYRVSTVLVAKGADVADDYIANHCTAGDLVITADIPLAARAVENNAHVITPYGRELDAENVRQALSMRDFNEELREMGVHSGGPPPFGPTQKREFASSLDRWISMSTR